MILKECYSLIRHLRIQPSEVDRLAIKEAQFFIKQYNEDKQKEKEEIEKQRNNNK